MNKVLAHAVSSPDHELDGLRDRHRELERQLAALRRHLALTPSEQQEWRRLKKEKLWVKDRIVALGGQQPG